MIILVLGYYQSEVLFNRAGIYTQINLSVPPVSGLKNLNDRTSVLNALNYNLYDLYTQLIQGPLLVPTLDQYLFLNDLFSNNFEKLGTYGGLLSQTQLGQTFTNLFQRGVMHFAPSGPQVDSLIGFLNNSYPNFRRVQVFIHSTESIGIDYIMNHLEQPTLALIVLRQISTVKVNYVIRQNYTTLPNSNLIVRSISTGLFTDYQQYVLSGFLSIQNGVDAWVFNYTNSIYSSTNLNISQQCNGPPTIVLAPYPTQSYNANPFFLRVGFLLGLAMVMATLYPLSRLMKSVVEEKELKLREVMKIMGLLDWAHQLSWFISAFILFFWIAISCTFLTKSSFLKQSSPLLLFAYFFLFTMSEVNFAFLLSTFFSNSKLAAIVGPVALFSSLLPRFIFLNTNANEEIAGKIIASLLSPTAFVFGADIIANFEYGNIGIQFSNMNVGKYSFQTVLTMMLIDFILYGLLAWYFDKVLPQEYGTVEKPWFIINWRYWCPKGPSSSSSTTDDASKTLSDMPEFYDYHSIQDDHPVEYSNNSSIESIPLDLREAAKVRCKSLRKRYDDGNLAVKDVSMSLVEGQITCLLGHNGAGKIMR